MSHYFSDFKATYPVWHPCAQMKDFETLPPLIVHKAEGSLLHTHEGTMIDATASWWCKSLGHGHPAILAAINTQLSAFEHVATGNMTHDVLVELSQKLGQLTNKTHAFYTSDGACAVEVALKMALHARQIRGEHERSCFISLKNSYHGETLGALSVSDLGLYKKPYAAYGFSCDFIEAGPTVSSINDSTFQDARSAWETVLPQLESIKKTVTAIIIEPILQGAGNMRCYSADFLKRLALWAKTNQIWLIADEIMTGLGRTGKWLALEHAGITADFICLSKGLTGGTLPLSAVLVDPSIYALFYGGDETRAFLHSHTHSGNALAARAALATLSIMEETNINEQATKLGALLLQAFLEIGEKTGCLENIRSIGAMVAAELTPKYPDIGYNIYRIARQQGALLRPLGNTLYWLPPLNISESLIGRLQKITLNSIHAAYKI